MNPIKNEKGYALLLVLMLVLLFTVLGMGLLAMNMNASKQFNLKEKQVQARHQAEMGVLHFKAQLENIVSDNKSKIDLACVDLKKSVTYLSDDKKAGYNIKNSNIKCEVTNDEIIITVESLGEYLDREDQIKAKFYVHQLGNQKWEDGRVPEPADYNDTVEFFAGSKEIENGFYTPAKNSLHVSGNLTVEKGNKDGGNDILINRNLYVDGNIEFKNHACLVTRGNLIVKGNISSTNKVYFFVYGDAYFKSINQVSKNNEIFVTGKVFENGKEVPNTFAPVPSGLVYSYGPGNDKKSCPLPGSGNPGLPSSSWDLDDEMNVDYFIN